MSPIILDVGVSISFQFSSYILLIVFQSLLFVKENSTKKLTESLLSDSYSSSSSSKLYMIYVKSTIVKRVRTIQEHKISR